MGKFFHALRQLYPPYLLGLVLFPMASGYIIDSVLFESRYLLINLVWIPFFTVPSLLLKNRVLFKIVVVLFFLVGLVELSHWILMKGPITLTSFLVIAHTNWNEALEFIDLRFSLTALLLIPYTWLFYKALRQGQSVTSHKTLWIVSGVIGLISLLFVVENIINDRFARKGSPQIVKVGLLFFEQIDLYREALQETEPRLVKAEASFEGKDQTFVLIIGESASRRHMSLYGASRKTNPRLESRNDLIIFDDVVAPYSYTLAAILSMLSESRIDQPVEFGESIDLIDVFHSAGFKTYWLSNQSPIGIWDNLVTVLANKADEVEFVNTSSNSSAEATLMRSYDDRLFKPFISALEEPGSKKFIVLHLMGSHSAYRKRYPKKFETFKAEDGWEKTIAEYDNSLLYNDFILDSILDILSSHSENKKLISAALYLGDHGENVYDEFGEVGHTYTKELPKANVEVPFFVWLSPEFSTEAKDKAATIRQNAGRPFLSDDLFHAVMDLTQIKSPYLEAHRSIFHQDFNSKRPRILEDGKDYDLK